MKLLEFLLYIEYRTFLRILDMILLMIQAEHYLLVWFIFWTVPFNQRTLTFTRALTCAGRSKTQSLSEFQILNLNIKRIEDLPHRNLIHRDAEPRFSSDDRFLSSQRNYDSLCLQSTTASGWTPRITYPISFPPHLVFDLRIAYSSHSICSPIGHSARNRSGKPSQILYTPTTYWLS